MKVELLYKKEDINLVNWIETITASRQLMLDNQSLICKVTSNRDEIIGYFDPQRLGQAIINLIENSIRYTPKNGSIFINLFDERSDILIELKIHGT
ncbi:hypothetical protein KHA80_21370 [Anaerobacillus sp. HL2]|nr:hypothetical protein KHA80_21370 [Anaerobacillus sp. HL2]